ncbi:MAG: DNA recombination protein RmuC, partial [Candidatus Paceibacteria bacterium]
MNETFLVFLVFILLLLNIGLFVMIWRMGGKKDDRGNDLLLKQMGELNRTMDAKIGESNRFMNESVSDQFNKSQKLIQDINQNVTEHLVNVTKKMTEANESSKQVFGIAEQLHSLEKVLKHQKQRGTLGETNLELILSNILDPTTYKMQYQFNSGETVDAVIMTKEGIIPIDAKFSLDNYNRITQEDDAERKAVLEKEFRNDLKKRIDETSKYIKTNEGTLPFAFMFIPAEGIYYDLLVNEIGTVKVNSRSLIDYAYNDKKV